MVFAAADSREGEMLWVERGDVVEPGRCDTSSRDGADGKLQKHRCSTGKWLNPRGMGVEVGKVQAGMQALQAAGGSCRGCCDGVFAPWPQGWPVAGRPEGVLSSSDFNSEAQMKKEGLLMPTCGKASRDAEISSPEVADALRPRTEKPNMSCAN